MILKIAQIDDGGNLIGWDISRTPAPELEESFTIEIGIAMPPPDYFDDDGGFGDDDDENTIEEDS